MRRGGAQSSGTRPRSSDSRPRDDQERQDQATQQDRLRAADGRRQTGRTTSAAAVAGGQRNGRRRGRGMCQENVANTRRPPAVPRARTQPLRAAWFHQIRSTPAAGQPRRTAHRRHRNP